MSIPEDGLSDIIAAYEYISLQKDKGVSFSQLLQSEIVKSPCFIRYLDKYNRSKSKKEECLFYDGIDDYIYIPHGTFKIYPSFQPTIGQKGYCYLHKSEELEDKLSPPSKKRYVKLWLDNRPSRNHQGSYVIDLYGLSQVMKIFRCDTKSILVQDEIPKEYFTYLAKKIEDKTIGVKGVAFCVFSIHWSDGYAGWYTLEGTFSTIEKCKKHISSLLLTTKDMKRYGDHYPSINKDTNYTCMISRKEMDKYTNGMRPDFGGYIIEKIVIE